MQWVRVSKAHPCPVCGRPDWCTVSSLGICCMRVQSARPTRNGGWLHASGATLQAALTPRGRPLPPSINASLLVLQWAEVTPESALDTLAGALGVSAAALASLNAVYAPPHQAWAFPMKDGYGNAVGVRLRANDGRKWAVRGSRQGIFLPETEPQRRVYVCEGPTDTAAALTIGLFAVGRPSCNCGGAEIRTACQRLGIREAVIVADNDRPGLQGAARVAGELGVKACIFVPPAKDIREFVQLGGTRQLIESELKNTVWLKQ